MEHKVGEDGREYTEKNGIRIIRTASEKDVLMWMYIKFLLEEKGNAKVSRREVETRVRR